MKVLRAEFHGELDGGVDESGFFVADETRTALVTGATSGIGWETARQLAGRGWMVLVHARTRREGRAAVDALAQVGVDRARLELYAADFARLGEVEELARQVAKEHPRLDALVNNAAVAAPERHTFTDDGNELALQVNFLAHYLLTRSLERELTGEPGGRVVNVSSSLHRMASIQWSDPHRSRRYSRLAAYAQSQLALTVFAADPRVTAVSVDPGVCDTALLPLYGQEGAAPAAEGAAHVVRLCDPATEVVGGAYYERDARGAPAAPVTEERTVRRLDRLASLLVGPAY